MDNLAGLLLLSLRFGLAIILFVFLFWSIRIIWVDFTRTAKTESLKSIPLITLSALYNNADIQQTFSVDEIILGRDLSCGFQISDETVSSKHTRLYFDHDQWWIEDFGSSNGSFLNEILVTTPAVLTQSDQLRLGKVVIEINFQD